MKTILITGLDGSGKSTLFEKLHPFGSREVRFLHVPTFHLDQLPLNYHHRKLCKRINQLGGEADVSKKPLGKIIALFSSMMLFSSIEQSFILSGAKLLFAERHPLIDSPMYALAYRELFAETSHDQRDFDAIDSHYANELTTILKFIDPNSSDIVSPSKTVLQNIFELFGSTELNFQKITDIFNCKTPDEIYFLDTDPNTLIQRIEGRQIKEYHETLTHLETMRTAYINQLKLFPQSTIIDSSEMKNIESLAKSLIAF